MWRISDTLCRIISIHALVKRATAFSPLYISPVDISIHALVKRATERCTPQSKERKNFNPRPREEGDYQVCGYVKGCKDFNPRPREEGDIHK